jgi:hypothetical protein
MPNPTGKGGFRPGQSGNVRGRPHGSQNTAARLRREIEEHAPAILEKLVYTASRGNLVAAKFLIERILPQAKSLPLGETFSLTGTLPEQAEHVKAMLAEGRINLDEASALLEALGAVQAISDAASLSHRVAELEARLAALSGGPAPALLPKPDDNA